MIDMDMINKNNYEICRALKLSNFEIIKYIVDNYVMQWW